MKECWECNITGMPLHNHHPVPRSRGGIKTIPLCEPCHSKAHHRKKNMNTSALVKEGLQRAKARGVVIGNKDIAKHGSKGRKNYSMKIDSHAETIVPRIKALKLSGVNSYTAIARHLNNAGSKTVNGKKWRATTVRNLCLQYGIIST